MRAQARWVLALASEEGLVAVLLPMRREDVEAGVVGSGSFVFYRREILASVDDVFEGLSLKDGGEDRCEEGEVEEGRFVGFDGLL